MTHSYVLAIHGGAGTISPGGRPESELPYHQALRQAAEAGEAVLAAGGSAVEAVVASVIALEDCPLFNAGRGSVYTSDALQEMDASLMDGRTRKAGAVAALRTVKHPILLAQAVMDKSDCVLLIGDGAERFARECGMPAMPPEYFASESRLAQLHRARLKATGAVLDHDGAGTAENFRLEPDLNAPLDPDKKFGTVGAVARDRAGNLAAAVSTGGMTNKRPGRVGDSPIIGAGCFADNRTVAVAATGTGEHFIRSVLAYDIAARMAYGQQTLEQAAHAAVVENLTAIEGEGGVIAVDRDGNLSLPFNTSGMYRASVREGKAIETSIFR